MHGITSTTLHFSETTLEQFGGCFLGFGRFFLAHATIFETTQDFHYTNVLVTKKKQSKNEALHEL